MVLVNGLVVVGVGALALLALSGGKGSSSGPSSVKGLPTSGGFEYRITPAGLQRFFDGKPVANAQQNAAFNVWQAGEFKKRQALLPKGRTPAGGNYFAAGDEFSKEAYWITPYVDNQTNVPVVLIDEFGRMYPGHYEAKGPSSPWDAITLTFSNPLFQAALVTALIASGPEGVAIYGAYQAWQHRGEGLSAKSVLLTAARSYAVSQCGPGCGVAFDMGLGVASGKSIDKVAEETLLGNMTPQERAAYENGRKALKGMS